MDDCSAIRKVMYPHLDGELGAEDSMRTLAHLAACLRARVDGKSTVDYLTAEAQSFVRQITRDWLLSPPD